MIVTVSIDLNDGWASTVSDAERIVTELISESLEGATSVDTWDVVKVEKDV